MLLIDEQGFQGLASLVGLSPGLSWIISVKQ